MIRTRWFELEPEMAAYTAAWLLAVVGALAHLWIKRRVIVGLVWNLDVRPGRGATFAFLEPQWLLPPAPGVTLRIVAWMLPFALFGAASLAYLVEW